MTLGLRVATRVGIGIGAYVVVAVALARLSVWLRDGYGQGDLAAFWLSTALSTPVLAAALLVFVLRTDASEPSPRWCAAAAVGWGVAFGLAATIAVRGVAGLWFGAFSFPVLLYGTAGAVAAFLCSAGLQVKARGLMMAGLLPAAALGAFLAYERASRPFEDLLVYFEPEVSRAQVERVWTDVRASALSRDVVLRGVASYNDRVAIRIAFTGRASGETRRSVRRLVDRAPGVVEVVDLTPYPRRRLRDGALPAKVEYDSVVQPEDPAVRPSGPE